MGDDRAVRRESAGRPVTNRSGGHVNGWIIAAGLCGWAAAATGLAVLIGAAVKLADCCPHAEAG